MSYLTRFNRRRVWTAGLAATLLIVTGCSSQAEVVVTETTTMMPGPAAAPSSSVQAQQASPTVSAPAPSSAPAPVGMVAVPTFGSVDLAPTTAVMITVFNAKIDSLSMTSGLDGTALAGTTTPDGSSWQLSQRMTYGTTYQILGSATGRDGTVTPIEGTLSTVAPADTQRASIQLAEGGIYGIATPIILTFAGTVTDKAAVEKVLKVSTDKGEIEGSWGWLQDEDIQGTGTPQSRVHFRTKDYWPGNTAVTVTADLYGLNLGDGQWGREDLSRNFTIGRSQVTIADVNSFRLIVKVDGVETKNYPVSYGRSTEDPELETRSGVHVVQEKFEVFEMCNPKYGYCGFLANWAVRISNNGEFIHENAAVVASLGKENVSHGCVNMGPADAKDYYDNTLYGDPVEVTGTSTQLGPSDGDIFDWTYSYDEWTNFSAL